jgi:hypothetical protein
VDGPGVPAAGGATAALRDATAIRPSPVERAEPERWLAPARATLDAAGAAPAWTEGGAMSLDQTVTYALEEAQDGA